MYNNCIVETSTKAGLLSNKVNIENAPFLNFYCTDNANTSVGRCYSGRKKKKHLSKTRLLINFPMLNRK